MESNIRSYVRESFSFHGEHIWIYKDPRTGWLYLGMRYMCEHLGLNWSVQRRKLKNNPNFAAKLQEFEAETSGGPQLVVGLKSDMVQAWLMMINPARVKVEQRGRIMLYQQELAKALHDYETLGHVHNPRFPAEYELLQAENARLKEQLSQASTSRASRTPRTPRTPKPVKEPKPWDDYARGGRLITSWTSRATRTRYPKGMACIDVEKHEQMTLDIRDVEQGEREFAERMKADPEAHYRYLKGWLEFLDEERETLPNWWARWGKAFTEFNDTMYEVEAQLRLMGSPLIPQLRPPPLTPEEVKNWPAGSGPRPLPNTP